jgi:hypothetical protein
MTGKTVKLTVGQAIVRYLINQFTIIDGERHQLFAGVFLVMVMLLAYQRPSNKFKTGCLHGVARTSNPWP